MPAPRSWSQRLRPGPWVWPGVVHQVGMGARLGEVTSHGLCVCLAMALFPARRSGLGNFLPALRVQRWPQLVRSWVNLELCSRC